MSFAPEEPEAVEAWIKKARPLEGVYYRSVEFRHMDPGSVLSGKGTALYGGRFAEVGTRAVYLAGSDDTATREVLARKQRLGNISQISLEKYPRIVFAATVSLQRTLTWLRRPRSAVLRHLREDCLSREDILVSQQLGSALRAAGIQGLLFPSVIGAGRNLIVYLDNCDESSLRLQNVDELRKHIEKTARMLRLEKLQSRP